MTIPINPETIEWLLDGDPAIRWQTMCDLVAAPESTWQAEQAKVGAGDDWAGRLLALQDDTGTWGGGVYSPKWKSTTYTLLTLIDCGLAHDHQAAIRGTELIYESLTKASKAKDLDESLLNHDLCVLGFYLRIGAVFCPTAPCLGNIIKILLDHQMGDGGWNCRVTRVRNLCHSSFHTTFNVLEGLREASDAGLIDTRLFAEAESRAMEFMLCHKLFRSDKTGDLINPHFVQLAYPPRWHYDILRGLDYIRLTKFKSDPRLDEAKALLESKQDNDGRWKIEHVYGGTVFFDMETRRGASRWITLRALRSLNCYC